MSLCNTNKNILRDYIWRFGQPDGQYNKTKNTVLNSSLIYRGLAPQLVASGEAQLRG